MMAAESPLASASAKKVLFTASLLGRPNDTLETPREVLQPSSRRILRSDSSVTRAAEASALTAMVSVSKMISFLAMPYSAAVFRIFSAICTLPSAVAGMPSSSSVSATRRPPYFFTSGKIFFILEALPLTELIMALPL